MYEVLIVLLLAGLVVAAISTALTRRLLTAVIIYAAYSSIMAIIWILLESPDLAITEAAVGAGVSGILFYLTLRRLNRIDRDQPEEPLPKEEDSSHEHEDD